MKFTVGATQLRRLLEAVQWAEKLRYANVERIVTELLQRPGTTGQPGGKRILIRHISTLAHFASKLRELSVTVEVEQSSE